MSSITETTCPKCGGYAEFHADDSLTYCQKEVREVMYLGAKTFVKRGGGCGWYGSEYNDYTPPDYRGG